MKKIILLFILFPLIIIAQTEDSLYFGKWQLEGIYTEIDDTPVLSIKKTIDKSSNGFFLCLHEDHNYTQDYISNRKKYNDQKLTGIWRYDQKTNSLILYRKLSKKGLRRYYEYKWNVIKRNNVMYASGISFPVIRVTSSILWLYDHHHKMIMKYTKDHSQVK